MNSVEKPIWKKVISFGIPIIGLFFVLKSVQSVYSLWRRGDIVDEKTQELKNVEREQDELKNKLSRSVTTSFIEEEARNKLGLVKPGETVVYVDKLASEGGSENEVVSHPIRQAQGAQSSVESETEKNQKSMLRQWFEVFF